jgi:ribosomal protein S18 acetylase RimI-like enzyme
MLAEMDGVVVGFTRIFWRTTEAGERVYWMFGYLKPEWRRKGIGRAQLTWLEERVRGIDREQPFFGPRFFQAVAEDTALGKTALLESNGYTRARYFFFMKHSNLNALPDSPRPADLELRPAHPDQMRAIWDAKEEAFRDHWGFAPKGEGLYQTWRNNPHHDLDLWRVAWDGDQIAGSCINGINPEDNEQFGFKRGWIHTLSVRRAWRGRGVARALLVESLRVLAARGMTEAVLGVDSENPTGALRLYESVGFKTINQDALYRKTLD